ncbi:MAG: metal ABC transporter permease [bacterium]|nr:MAG: metal ABC transporter permease [bacterium]
MIDIMLPAFAECLVLVGIHSYLGIHVIKRKVIFVDLALAQIAALGSTFAFLFGIDPSSAGAYWFSLGFTVIGAAVFSISRIRHEKIPQEAVIGLVYALAAAMAILVIDKAPHGAEHIKEIMTGSILWVKWDTILIAAVVYLLVGIFHYIYRENFLLISTNPEMAYQKGLNVRFWDFLFYVSFGIVITHSVSTAGVLLVFVFLVVPAIATIMITDKLWLQLVLGWIMGTLVSMLGLFTSYVADLPSGPAVVATYGLVLLITTLGVYVFRANRKIVALKNIGLGFAVFSLAVLVFWVMGQGFGSQVDHEHRVMEHADLHEHDHPEGVLLIMSDQELQETLAKVTDKDSLLLLYNKNENLFQRFEIAHRIYDLHKKLGTQKLIDFLDFCEIPFLRQKALDMLMIESGDSFGYDALKDHDTNIIALEKWHKWWIDRYSQE